MSGFSSSSSAHAGSKNLLKLVILGDSNVGKTSLMHRYVSTEFIRSYKATIGADFSTKDVVIGDTTLTLQLWDTAGMERYQSLGQAFYRGADCCVLVYDVTNPSSFSKLKSDWRNAFIKYGDVQDPANFPFLVLGNKEDIKGGGDKRFDEDVKTWCKETGNMPHFLVSAKTGLNVEEAFLTVIKAAHKRGKSEEPMMLPETLKLNIPPPAPAGCSC